MNFEICILEDLRVFVKGRLPVLADVKSLYDKQCP